MVSYLSWAANAVLFVAACFLAASTANTVFAAMLAPEPAVVAPPPSDGTPGGRRARSHQGVVDRDLFRSATLEATGEPTIATEAIEETKLPLDLLGTAAAEDPALAWAAILDREDRQTLVVGIGDRLKDKADVVRIERRRLVLLENGVHRELTFGDDGPKKPPVTRAANRYPRRPTAGGNRRSARVRRTGDDRVEVTRDDLDDMLRNPSDLLSQARFLPKYEDGEMLGFQVNAIKKGSVLEDLGLSNGDIIREFNGVEISSPQESAKLLQELGSSKEFEIVVQDRSGNSRREYVDLTE